MSSTRSEFLDSLGLFAVRDFLDREFCSELVTRLGRSNLQQSPLPQGIGGRSAGTVAETRPEVVVSPVPGFGEEISKKLEGILPEIEEFYGIRSKRLQPPYFAVYGKGDYFGKHSDAHLSPSVDDETEPRKISFVIFLNDESDESGPGVYTGGRLTFYGLLENKVFGDFGYPVQGEAGKLIAFRSTTLHEVTTITSGLRYVCSSACY